MNGGRLLLCDGQKILTQIPLVLQHTCLLFRFNFEMINERNKDDLASLDSTVGWKLGNRLSISSGDNSLT